MLLCNFRSDIIKNKMRTVTPRVFIKELESHNRRDREELAKGNFAKESINKMEHIIKIRDDVIRIFEEDSKNGHNQKDITKKSKLDIFL